MLDPVAVPILLKTLDFLFEEGRKILQERRERRNARKPSNIDSNKPATTENNNALAIQSKDKAIRTRIEESAWLASEDEIIHLLSLLDVYTKNYYLAKEQYAKYGGALVPQVIIHNLTEAEDGIELTMKKVKLALSKVYGGTFKIPEID